MKVVIFCGGFGVRMGDETRLIPKPMVRIGDRPILWHIMRYYASFGHDEFVLCLGYRGDAIEDYFLDHRPRLSDDLSPAERRDERRDGDGTRDDVAWRITFAHTGADATIAERLKAVAHHLGPDEVFLATYGDGVTDAPLNDVIRSFHDSRKTVTFLSVQPQFNAHLVYATRDGTVVGIEDMSRSGVRINGGFFVCRRELLDWIEPGDELVEETFARLIARREVGAYVYDGFFGPMDTIKDRQRLEGIYATGRAPWLLVGSNPAFELRTG